MNPAQNTIKNNDSNKTGVSPQTVSSGIGKEKEALVAAPSETISAVTQEVVLPKEVEKAGVEIVKETIELPPDVKKLGVTPVGPFAPVTTSALPQVVLPISDQTVIAGLHAQILNSLRWLAVWCIKKLKKAHLALKNIHGKIVRVKT